MPSSTITFKACLQIPNGIKLQTGLYILRVRCMTLFERSLAHTRQLVMPFYISLVAMFSVDIPGSENNSDPTCIVVIVLITDDACWRELETLRSARPPRPNIAHKDIPGIDIDISTFLYFYISTPRTDDAYDLLSLDDLDLSGQRDS